jgi:hypothetical protein
MKTCQHVAPDFGENISSCFTMTTPRLTLPSSPSSFCQNTNGCHPPPNVLSWFGTLWLLPIPKSEIESKRTPVWYHWGEIQAELRRVLDTLTNKGLPGSVPKMEETVGPVSKYGRELLRGWWRPRGFMVSFVIFTASVRNILDRPSYLTQDAELSSRTTLLGTSWGKCGIRNVYWAEYSVKSSYKSKTKEFLYRPWGFQEVEAPRFPDNRYTNVARLSAQNTVRLHPPPTPRNYTCYSFLLETESTIGSLICRNDYVNEKFQLHYRESNLQPSVS